MTGWTSILRGAAAACLALTVGTPLIGCQTPLERAWGRSQSAHTAQMTANPKAGLDDNEARRPDGTSTDAALVRWRTKETKPETPAPPPVININSGG